MPNFGQKSVIMKSKALLFIGIGMLIIGILLRKVFYFEITGLILILTGVLMKTVYIIAKAKSGEYKPGTELIYLFAGLTLFMTGLYLRSIHYDMINPVLMIGTGISLKVLFIVLFIKKTRQNRKGLIE